MLTGVLSLFPLLLPGLLLFWVYKPDRKQHPTIGAAMLATGVAALGLSVLSGHPTSSPIVNFAFLYVAYLVPLAWSGLYISTPLDGRVAMGWFLAAILLGSLLL